MTAKTNLDNRAHRQRIRTLSFLTQDETTRLFSAIKNKRDRDLFLTAYRHRLRACEIGYCPRNAPTPHPASRQRTNGARYGGRAMRGADRRL